MDPSPESQAAQQALAAVQTIAEGMILVDRDNRVTFMNASAETITGWLLQDALGMSSGLIFRIINSITREPDWQPVQPSMEDDHQYLLLPNSLLVRKDGSEVPVEDTVSPIHDETGNVIGAVILFKDVKKNREILLQLLKRLHRDPLTNLHTRAFFGDFLSAFQDAGNHFALLYLDLNHFKQINDTWGHLAGDLTLQVFAHRLRTLLPDDSVLCRWGGDEFVVLLRDIHHVEEVYLIVNKLHKVLEEEILWGMDSIVVSASIGFAMGNEANKADLLAIADGAMYKAKRLQRRVPRKQTSSPSPRAQLREKETRALLKLEEQQLVLYYQPILKLSSNQIIGAEALLRRSQSPEDEMSLPEDFIVHAERNGSIITLGRAILREALQELRRWQRAGATNMSLAVNVSATELLDPGYLVNLDHLLAEEMYSGQGLILEVTESVLLQPNTQGNIVSELRERQLRVAIDDFGMGYSNLSQLRRSPFDIIKIDRDFLRQVPWIDQDKKLVTAIVDMAHSLERVVIAEGVETHAQRDFLAAIACDQAQGFLFSSAIPATELALLFEASVKAGGFA